MATIQHFRDLRAWKHCREVRQRIRLLVKTWPSEEKYMLTGQIIRSSRGPTSHIAEGYGRFYEKENVRFCRIARGSLYETQDHLITAYDEGYLDGGVLKEHIGLIENAIKTLNAYVNYLESIPGNRKDQVSEPPATYGIASGSIKPSPSENSPLDADI